MIEMDESEYADYLTDDEKTYLAIDRFFKHDRTFTEKLLYTKPVGERDEKMVDNGIRIARNHPA